MERTLIVIRHAKSDWDVPLGDSERPLADRGRRQAPAVGRWIATHLGSPDLAVVSPAARALQTWELVAAELSPDPPVRVEPDAYTFSGDDLLDVVSGLPADVSSVALVGHNPAAEELVEALTGRWVRLPTASVAVVGLRDWRSETGRLRAAGRPADEDVELDRRR